MFLYPVDPDRDQCPNYLEVITHPMDLSTVASKLDSGEYSSVSQFKGDVELIWSNAIQYNGKKSFIGLIASQLRSLFLNETINLTDNEITDWLSRANSLKTQLSGIMKNEPKTLVPPPPPRESTRKQLSRQASAPIPPQPALFHLTKEETTKLAEEVNSLTDEGQIEQIITLIQTHEPELLDGEEIKINVNALQQKTLIALRTLVDKFVREK